jgi:hypothetical protein
MRILLDADTLLEFFRNRSEFIGKVEYLSEIFRSNSSIQVYLSKPGLDKIVSLQALNEKESEQLVAGLRKRIKILRVTKAVVKKASSSSALDYESAVEIHLAIKAHIGAIVTHKPSDFSSEELNVITLSDLQQRNHLEVNFSKNIKDLPAVLVINSEQISNLDKAFYHLPSYTDVKSLEPKESSHQLDITCSSAKVSIASDDKSSLRSRRFQAIEQIFLDALSQPVLDRSTAQVNAVKLSGLAGKSSINALKASIDRDKLSMKSFAQIESKRFGGIADTALQAHKNLLGNKLMKDILPSGKGLSSAVDSLSIRPPAPQLIRQLESTIFGDLTATVPQPYENSLGSKLKKDELQMAKWLSLAVDSLSIKSPIPQPIRQLESKRFGVIAATAPQPYENSLGGKLTKDMLQMAKGLSLSVDSLSNRSFSDRSGLLSQSKLLESMQTVNTLESYLSRKKLKPE